MANKTDKRKSGNKTEAAAEQPSSSYLSKIESEVKSNQSRLSMVLGALILLVLGILIFNYFNKTKSSLGPAQQTQQENQDVTADKLPGKYTVKEGDTLFLIAETYYKDGEKFTEIAKANNLTDANNIEKDQVLEIPKLAETFETMTTPQPDASVSPDPTPDVVSQTDQTDLGTGGGNTTMWGSKIDGATYTVQADDWLSTIAARAYDDINSYQKLANANNIQNVDFIYPGQVLTIPR